MKRFLSAFLVAILIFALLPPMQADAALHSQTEVVAWLKSMLGRSVDLDGVYGAQCVDLILAYYDYMGVPRSSGNGKDYATNTLPNGWQRIKGATPQVGDILVYGYSEKNKYGHVAIYESDYSTYHQNFSGNYIEQVTRWRYNEFTNPYWGVIRPDFTPEVPADIGTDFTAPILNTAAWKVLENCYTEGDKPPVRIAAYESTYANQLWYFSRQSDGSYKISSCYDGKYLDVRDANMGAGAVIQTCVDSGSDAQKWYISNVNGSYVLRSKLSGYVVDLINNDATGGNQIQTWYYNGSNAQIWSIYKGDESKLSAPVVTVTPGTPDSETFFQWKDVYGEKAYDLRIFQGNAANGAVYKSVLGAQPGVGVTLPAGTYTACVQAYHYYDKKTSAPITFTVESTCSHDYGSWEITTAAGCETTGAKTRTCTLCSKQETESIPPTGHDWNTTVIPANCQHTQQTRSVCRNCGDEQLESEPMEYSEWVEILPDDVIQASVETMTQYRYRDRLNTWSDPVTHTVEYAWPQDTEDWQGVDRSGTFYQQYNHVPVSASETNSEKVTEVSTEHIGYLYFHWCKGRVDGPYNRVISNCYETDYPYFHAFTSTEAGSDYDTNGSYGATAKYLYNNACCTDTWWWRQIPIYRQTYTVQTKTQSTDGWGEWSEWFSGEVTSSETRQIQERTLYRYVTNLGEHTYTDGDKTHCSVCTHFREDDTPGISPSQTDYNRDGAVTAEDAIYLVWHNLFPGLYPVSLSGDANGDGTADMQDAAYLLWYALDLL